MQSRISVEGIDCYAYHGCLPEERVIGGHYRVDVHFEMDLESAIIQDDLTKTIDYVVVNKVVREQMAIPSKLLEHVAGRILKELAQTFPGKKTIELKVTKFNPPVNTQLDRASIVLSERFQS